MHLSLEQDLLQYLAASAVSGIRIRAGRTPISALLSSGFTLIKIACSGFTEKSRFYLIYCLTSISSLSLIFELIVY
jgi:hypothetical protein